MVLQVSSCQVNHNVNRTKTRQALSQESVKMARNYLSKFFSKETTIEDHTDEYPKFSLDELELGKFLGTGGFSSVSEIRGFKISDTRRSVLSRRDGACPTTRHRCREFLQDHCIRPSCGRSRYAIKMLTSTTSPKTASGESHLLRGTIDMAIETRILSHVKHPHIVKLHATAKCDPVADPNYFLVMDRLYDVLDKRLETWEQSAKQHTSLAGRIMTDRKGSKGAALYEERVVVALHLASALHYLHRNNIIYRDLKPENVGFDIMNNVKLFDFGLARELHVADRNPVDPTTYLLTGMTGSLRFMAGEVAQGKPYNATCDSYSFAILFWQIMALKRPFAVYTARALSEKVHQGEHRRPFIPKDWNPNFKNMLEQSWDADIKKRLCMGQMEAILRKESTRQKGKEDGRRLDHRRGFCRSTSSVDCEMK